MNNNEFTATLKTDDTIRTKNGQYNVSHVDPKLNVVFTNEITVQIYSPTIISVNGVNVNRS